MNYTVTVNENKRTIEVLLEGKYKGVAKCCKSDSYNLQTGLELALERARVAKANAEMPKIKNAEDMSIRELGLIIERKLNKLGNGQVVIIGEGRVPSAEQKNIIHSYTDCKGGYDEGYEKGYDEGYEAALEACSDDYDNGYADGYNDAVDEYDECDEDYDEECDCDDDACDCDDDCDEECECDCHKTYGGVVVISGRAVQSVVL